MKAFTLLRRETAVILLAAAIIVALIGCSSNSGNSGISGQPAATNGEQSQPPKEEKPISFKIASWAQPGAKDSMENVITEYKKLKPHVTITFEETAQNNTDFDTWMTAQLSGNQEPEVVMDFAGEPVYAKYVDKGYKVLELSPYLEQTSPYTNERWGNSFRDVDLNFMRASKDGGLYNLATQLVTLKIAYNKDIYNELGLQAPNTYSEMIENFRKIREAGKAEPFAGFLKISAGWDWFARFVGQQVQEHFVDQIDVLNPNIQYEMNEYVRAVNEGIVDPSMPEIRAVYELFKEFSSYFAPGAIAMSLPDAVDLWLQGKAAHTFSINYDAQPFSSDQKPSFEWDTFEFPKITKDTIATSNEDPAEFGDLSNAFVVMPSAISKGIQDEIMDFIMFYTSPEVAAKLANERWLIPTTVGVEPSEEIEKYLPKNRPQRAIDLNTQWRVSAEARQFTHQEIQRYVLGDITTDQLIDSISKKAKEEAAKTMKENGWTKENNYGTQ